ncbi:DNA primase [Eggerthellaceae bacterium zg-887]|uniref:DNA primase n=1 Tax=Xiamenia xianingshaonis TaxID=2682776 RepID=UPI001407AF1F|nr:DNA primase [Xiamenia xianingshaonis]NHM16195.1 DNA primase [Xiamenia xianingshaonis]
MAGSISSDDIRRVREASDLVALFGETNHLVRKGRDFWCCCPFHNEKTPSLKIDPNLQLWHCFGCGEGGDVFSYVQKLEGLNFPESVRLLADRAHIDIVEERGRNAIAPSQKERLKQVCAATAIFYHTQLMRSTAPDAAAARSYLHDRGLGGTVPKTWKLGFAPGRNMLVNHLASLGFSSEEMLLANVAVARDGGPLRDRFYNRVMFPIFDERGDCIAFGGRVVGAGEPKYLNSQETPIFHKSSVLFGLKKARPAITETGIAVVAEGYTDVIALHESGITNAVATLGTALTMRHIRLLSRYSLSHRTLLTEKKGEYKYDCCIVYLFDGDKAGQRAADRALSFIDEYNMKDMKSVSLVELKAIALPDNLDPADFVAERGGEALRELLEKARPLIQYIIDLRLAKHDLSRPEGRAAAMSDALSVLAPIKNSMLARSYAREIAGLTRFREDDVLRCLAALQVPKDGRAAAAEQPHSRPAAAYNPDVSPEPVVAGRPPLGGAESPLSQGEASRRRMERRLLAVLAQYPQLGLKHSDALAATSWHVGGHRAIAEALLEGLVGNADVTAAELVGHVSRTVAGSVGILTEDAVGGLEGDPGAAAERLAAFLAEELSIGDAEDALAALKARLANPGGMDAEENETLFQAVVSMQQDLAARKRAHRPLI